MILTHIQIKQVDEYKKSCVLPFKMRLNVLFCLHDINYYVRERDVNINIEMLYLQLASFVLTGYECTSVEAIAEKGVRAYIML